MPTLRSAVFSITTFIFCNQAQSLPQVFLDRLLYYTHYLNTVVFKSSRQLWKRIYSLLAPSRYKGGLSAGTGMSLLKGSRFFLQTCGEIPFLCLLDFMLHLGRDSFSILTTNEINANEAGRWPVKTPSLAGIGVPCSSHFAQASPVSHWSLRCGMRSYINCWDRRLSLAGLFVGSGLSPAQQHAECPCPFPSCKAQRRAAGQQQLCSGAPARARAECWQEQSARSESRGTLLLSHTVPSAWR